MDNAEKMRKLHGIINEMNIDLREAFKPLIEQEGRIMLEFKQSDNFDRKSFLLTSREAILENRMRILTRGKQVVEDAASMCRPEGRTLELLTAFLRFIEKLQSDVLVKKQALPGWVNIVKAEESLRIQNAELREKESQLIELNSVMMAKESGAKVDLWAA